MNKNNKVREKRTVYSKSYYLFIFWFYSMLFAVKKIIIILCYYHLEIQVFIYLFQEKSKRIIICEKISLIVYTYNIFSLCAVYVWVYFYLYI
jgi:hypothetical protein